MTNVLLLIFLLYENAVYKHNSLYYWDFSWICARTVMSGFSRVFRIAHNLTKQNKCSAVSCVILMRC